MLQHESPTGFLESEAKPENW